MAAITARKGHEACSGCSLCLLACPVWHATRDIRLTPHGRSKALQHGVAIGELAESVEACTLCGACEPACPEDMALVDMVLDLRARLAREVPTRLMELTWSHPARAVKAAALLIPDKALSANAPLLERTAQLLGATLAGDAGADIAGALEAGAALPAARLEAFLAPLHGGARLIVGDGLLFRKLASWLPDARRASLGEALSGAAAVAAKLGAEDFYVIEPRAYHADRERLVRHYDALRRRTGCGMNMDLQRLAVPTTAGSLATVSGKSRVDLREQARWMLEGREFRRVIVEDVNDIGVFSAVVDVPVLHVSELVEA